MYFKNIFESWGIQEYTHFMDTKQIKAGIVSHTSRMRPCLQWGVLVFLPSNIVGQESSRENSNIVKSPIMIFVLATFIKGAQFPSHLLSMAYRYFCWTFYVIKLCLIVYYEREQCILPVIHVVSYLSILLFNHHHSTSAICILWIPLSTYSELIIRKLTLNIRKFHHPSTHPLYLTTNEGIKHYSTHTAPSLQLIPALAEICLTISHQRRTSTSSCCLFHFWASSHSSAHKASSICCSAHKWAVTKLPSTDMAGVCTMQIQPKCLHRWLLKQCSIAHSVSNAIYSSPVTLSQLRGVAEFFRIGLGVWFLQYA